MCVARASNFMGFFSVSITQKTLINDDEMYNDVYVHMENVPEALYRIRTCINPLNNSRREHTMIYAHRPRISDSSRVKLVRDNVNA